MVDIHGNSQKAYFDRENVPFTHVYHPNVLLQMTPEQLSTEIQLFYDIYCKQSNKATRKEALTKHQFVNKIC
jgi:hypothetical protein